jgi:L-lactate dehydrogenase complex protein LldG
VPRAYRGPGDTAMDDVVGVFCERVAEYKATVTRVGAGDLGATVTRLCAERGARRIAVPPGGPDVLRGVEVVVDDPPLSPHALDQLDGVMTGCALAIAETGTIVLDGGARSGRRALTLVPDWHICIVEEEAVVAGVPDAVAALAEAAADGRPITLVSGPSATSDIELDRVEGVHGPRTLEVVVVSA